MYIVGTMKVSNTPVAVNKMSTPCMLCVTSPMYLFVVTDF